MRVIVFLLLLLSGFSVTVYGQRSVSDSLALLFHNQLEIFPQEKIHIHTDKPYYLSGEKIWFRAYLSDAATHIPGPFSRYVYVELINPLDSVVTRVKIRPDSLEAFHGYVPIPDDVPEGNYTLRAYTTYMRSLEEHYFFTKTIHIGDPQARVIDIKTHFFFESDRRVYATFRFSYIETAAPMVPQSTRISINEGKAMNLPVDDDGRASVHFNLPASSSQRVMLLEVMVDNKPYRQFIQISAPDNDFDLSFYPEGGSLMLGTVCRVVFKAMQSDGCSTEVSGAVYDQTGTAITAFKTDHAGMGSFVLMAEQGKNYYAVCQNNNGQSKRFDLPDAVTHGYALSVSRTKEHIHISVCTPAKATQEGELYLLAHTRGMIQLIERWDDERERLTLPVTRFPSGVLHVLLIDSRMVPVSERLVFINNHDQAKVIYHSDKEGFEQRSLVHNRVVITDSDGEPLVGNFSVSVTSDREVMPDSTTNILTQLLLTSDLRGYIEDPAYYFQNTTRSASALDLLMCTQGWRRYNMAEVMQGRPTRPAFPLEAGLEISGTVTGVLSGKTVEDVEVTAASVTGGLFNSGQTDKEGRFYLPINEFPDSLRFIVSAAPKKGLTRLNLTLDSDYFPGRTLPPVPSIEVDKSRFAHYADKAEQQYIYEGGIRVTELSASVVTAERKAPQYASHYYAEPDISLTEDKIKKIFVKDIYGLIERLPGVQVLNGTGDILAVPIIIIRGVGSYKGPPEVLVLVNNIPVEVKDLRLFNVNDVAQIDVLIGASAAIFGTRGGDGVISIFTKDGRSAVSNISPSLNINILNVSGFQQPAEFYTPKYETTAQRNNPKPDLRTTIHWQPVVQTDSSGKASFEFYTADEQTSYTVIIEGLANDGTVIRKEEKMWQNLPIGTIK